MKLHCPAQMYVRLWVACAAVLAPTLGSASAAAQSATLNQFRPAPLARDGFAISTAEDQGHAQFGAQLYFDFAWNPQGVPPPGPSATERQTTQTLFLNVGLWDRLVLWTGLPFILTMKGRVADGAGLGDLSLGARVRVLGGRDDLVQLGVQGRLFFPTAKAVDTNQMRSGEQTVAGLPELVLQLNTARVRIPLNLGVLIRRGELVGGPVNDMLVLGVGIHIDAIENTLAVLVEAFTNTGLQHAFQHSFTDFEALAGLKYFHQSGLSLGAGMSVGAFDGFGAPDFRVIGMAAYTRQRRKGSN